MNDNRIMKGMQEWLVREQNIANLFSPATLHTRYFQQLKLDYLRELNTTVRRDGTKDERMTSRILRGEIRDMEKRLYPRTVMRIFVAIVRGLKNTLRPEKKPSAFERTNWMMKVEKKESALKKESQAKVFQQRKVQPGLVEKKRQSNDKGLGI